MEELEDDGLWAQMDGIGTVRGCQKHVGEDNIQLNEGRNEVKILYHLNGLDYFCTRDLNTHTKNSKYVH